MFQSTLYRILAIIQFVMLCLFFQDKALAQDNTDFDTAYVKSYRDNFVLTILSEKKDNFVGMNFRTPTYKYQLKYKTNTTFTYGFCIDYKWVCVELTTKIPGSQPDVTKGITDNFGIGFGFTFRKWVFRNFLERNKGYYLNNTDAWLPNYNKNNSPYYLRQDISTSTYYASLNYTVNYKKFSNIASLWQLERQKHMAGSVVIGASYIYNNFYADSSIVPTTGNDTFPRNNNTFFSLNAIGVNTGWMGTMPLFKSKEWFLSAAIIPGASYQFGQLTLENMGTVRNNKLIGLQSEFRFSFGYNGDKLYLGYNFRAFGNLNAVNQNDPMAITNIFSRIYLGYRFDLPKAKSNFMKMLRL